MANSSLSLYIYIYIPERVRSVQLGISGYSHDPDSSPTDVSPYHYQQQRTANSGEAYHKNQYTYIHIYIFMRVIRVIRVIRVGTTVTGY